MALRILPGRQRRDLAALYGFERQVDEAGDELEGDRLAALDEIDRQLDTLFAGGEPSHPLLRELARTVHERGLSEAPLRDLVEANRRDQSVHDYGSWAELSEYCALSANPVGRLVLEVFGVATSERIGHSDRVCTALQLVEHCQDVREDAERGRIYLPREERQRFGVGNPALRATRADEPLRRLIAFELVRVRSLLADGTRLVASLRGFARLAVAGFVAGGLAAADAIERRDHDVMAGAPRARRRDVLRHAWRLWWSRPAPGDRPEGIAR